VTHPCPPRRIFGRTVTIVAEGGASGGMWMAALGPWAAAHAWSSDVSKRT